MNINVLGMGNALIDIVTELPNDKLLTDLALRKGSMQLVDRLFSENALSQVQHLERTEKSGGSAANTICGLGSLGFETAFIGKVGNDRLGEVFQNDLRHYGVKPLMQFGTTETGVALTLVSRNGERTFATYLGAAVEMEPIDLNADLFQNYSHFYIEGYLVQHHELIRKAVELAKESGLDVVLDLASFNVVEDNLDFLHFLVKEYADIVFANTEEAKAFTGLKDPEKALNAIAQDCWIAVVKRGDKGSIIQNGKNVYHVPAEKVNCIDTTGAGDLYASGFLYGLFNNMKLSLCGEIGTILAGKVIEVMGAKIPDAEWPGLKERIKEVTYKQL
ncbi:MAG: adenosine kinase [Bacteroidales bacterium]|jgi:sugar/nucleoside kinase (ribokinase family)|nr:adenosine kinase [Bacteroidales bacterium]